MTTFTQMVQPVYGHLTCHTRIFEHAPEVQWRFQEELRHILHSATDHTIHTLLYDQNWRTSLVAAWILFLKNNHTYVADIGNLLLQGKAGTIGYCYALAKFGTPECRDYLIRYLKKELLFDRFPTERFQDTALYALMYTDRTHGTDFSGTFLKPDGLWVKFTESECFRNTKLADSPRWGNTAAGYTDFVRMFDFMNTIATTQQ